MPYDLAILTEVGEALWVRAAGQARFQLLAQLPQVQMLDLSPDGRTLPNGESIANIRVSDLFDS